MLAGALGGASTGCPLFIPPLPPPPKLGDRERLVTDNEPPELTAIDIDTRAFERVSDGLGQRFGIHPAAARPVRLDAPGARGDEVLGTALANAVAMTGDDGAAVLSPWHVNVGPPGMSTPPCCPVRVSAVLDLDRPRGGSMASGCPTSD